MMRSICSTIVLALTVTVLSAEMLQAQCPNIN